MSNLVGATTAVFPVHLSIASNEIINVGWRTIDGTAKGGIDYQALDGVVRFLPGEIEGKIEVLVYGGMEPSAADSSKIFYIRLDPPSGAILESSLLACKIIVDVLGEYSVVSVIVAEGRRGLKGEAGRSAYEQAVYMGLFTGTVEQWMQQIADASSAADRAENAAVAANIGSKVYATPQAGVNINTGVPAGDYFNVRSLSSNHYVDEYQNVAGVATATGKSYPNIGWVERNAAIAEAAAISATISSGIYQTPSAGVAPVTGVPVGDYFNVRSVNSEHYVDEYQNVAGVATATGKSYPSSLAVDLTKQQILDVSDRVGNTWRNKVGGYGLNDRVMLENGDIVKSTAANNIIDPNVDMTGWRFDNDVVNSIAELLAIQNPKDGMRVFVKAYHIGYGVRGYDFVYDSSKASINNKVTIIAGWINLTFIKSKVISPYDIGLKLDGSDETAIFDNAIPFLQHKVLDLAGGILKTYGFHIQSNMTLQNGTIDFSSSNYITSANVIGDGYVKRIGDLRNTQGEWPNVYSKLDYLENVAIQNIKFIIPENAVGSAKVFRIVKCRNFVFKNNSATLGDQTVLLHIIGGHVGTDLSSVGQSDIVDKLLNDRCSGIYVYGNNVVGTKSYCQIVNLVSCEKAVIMNNVGTGALTKITLDQFNRNCIVSNNSLTCDDEAYTLINTTSLGDTMSYYIGQGSYNILFDSNSAHNFGYAGIYVEAAKRVTLKNNKITITKGLPLFHSWQPAIKLQSNVYFMNGQNTDVVGRTEDVLISNCKLESQRQGILVDAYAAKPKNITISDTTVSIERPLEAIALSGINIEMYNVKVVGGGVGIKGVEDCTITNVKVRSPSNYALILSSLLNKGLVIKNSSFITDEGQCVSRDGVGTTESESITIVDTHLEAKDKSNIFSILNVSPQKIDVRNARPTTAHAVRITFDVSIAAGKAHKAVYQLSALRPDLSISGLTPAIYQVSDVGGIDFSSYTLSTSTRGGAISVTVTNITDNLISGTLDVVCYVQMVS